MILIIPDGNGYVILALMKHFNSQFIADQSVFL